eukprot:CAMPEP_0119271612 /NCGR_PEP_ID=MMETSP1329-20130426/8135_1 /TAXON_ID=114041 /ORGANISM="Genus nov. species nov., Strain RCC1024" /LENGTH=451 /DNA_ID=CAMNT_0007271661 /DNA_START=161 /DNA_END=1512 /DNA_ORIENTATION=+
MNDADVETAVEEYRARQLAEMTPRDAARQIEEWKARALAAECQSRVLSARCRSLQKLPRAEAMRGPRKVLGDADLVANVFEMLTGAGGRVAQWLPLCRVCRRWRLAGDAMMRRFQYLRVDNTFSEDALLSLAASCPNITCFSTAWSRGLKVSDASLACLGRWCGRLDDVVLTRCERVTDAGIASLVAHLPLLRDLKLNSCGLVTGRFLSAVARACPKLRLLECEQMKGSEWGFEELALLCTQLVDFKLAPFFGRGEQLPDVMPLIRAGRLTSLTLDGGNIGYSDEVLAAIGTACPRLTTLRLEGCRSATVEPLVAIARGCPLEELYLYRVCPVFREMDALILAIGRLETLEDLEINNCGVITTSAWLSLVGGCPALESLRIKEYSSVTDDVLAALAQKRVIALDFDECDHVTDAGIREFHARCPMLQSIDVRGCAVSEAALEEMDRARAAA